MRWVFGPVRKLQTSGQQIMAAAIAQNEARAAYGMLVQSARSVGTAIAC